MLRKTRTILAAALAFMGLFGSGCQSVFRAETILHADGRVERAIYQQLEQTPGQAKDPKHWSQTTFAPNPGTLEQQGWPASLTRLPIRTSAWSQNYFAAWGSFASPKDIPNHVLIRLTDHAGAPESKLTRQHDRADYVFVVEHRWRETLTDCVTWEGMHQAREELLRLNVHVFHDAFTEMAPEYDDIDLLRWLKTDVRSLMNEVTDFMFVSSAVQKGPDFYQRAWKGIVPILARDGLKLPDRTAEFNGEEFRRNLQSYLTDQICRRVRRRKDGQPADRATVNGWFGWQHSAPLKAASGPPIPFDQAWDKTVATKYGGEEAFTKRRSLLFQRVAGANLTDVLHDRQFNYSLTMPGEIIETNGRLEGAKQVRWIFEGKEAYPLGYTMECRSLALQPDALKETLRETPRLNRKAMIEFVAIVAGQQRLPDVLRECRRQKSMRPLYDYRHKIAALPNTTNDINSVNRLLRLLKQPLLLPDA